MSYYQDLPLTGMCRVRSEDMLIRRSGSRYIYSADEGYTWSTLDIDLVDLALTGRTELLEKVLYLAETDPNNRVEQFHSLVPSES